MTASWQAAWRDHRALLLLAGLYSAATLGEAYYYHVPLASMASFVRCLILSFLMPISFLVGLYTGALAGHIWCRQEGFIKALADFYDTVRAYLRGPRLAYASMAFLALQSGVFFLIPKALIGTANPFSQMQWDFDFAAWDKVLHHGIYPHAYVIPFINRLGMGHTLDLMYFFWFVVMTVVAGYNLFADGLLHRRMRYLAGYILSWIVLGSLMATWLSSAGPMFVGDFFPGKGDDYAPILANMRDLQSDYPLISEAVRKQLLEWSSRQGEFTANAISAMPSLHLAISWLIVLYCREIGLKLFIVMLAYFGIVFLGSIYFGFHYAIDGYAGVIGASLIWWATGKWLDKRYARDQRIWGQA